jgi:hypothetical protein
MATRTPLARASVSIFLAAGFLAAVQNCAQSADGALDGDQSATIFDPRLTARRYESLCLWTLQSATSQFNLLEMVSFGDANKRILFGSV